MLVVVAMAHETHYFLALMINVYGCQIHYQVTLCHGIFVVMTPTPADQSMICICLFEALNETTLYHCLQVLRQNCLWFQSIRRPE
jgi:hypothetical protein